MNSGTARLVNDDDGMRRILTEIKRIAVLGIKASGRGPAYDVPLYLQEQGYDILPVNPKLDEVLGVKVVHSLDAIDEPVDLIDVFRRSEAIPGHVDEILRMKYPPKYVWLQLGIRNDEAAARLVEAGIAVVQDRCMLQEHRRLM